MYSDEELAKMFRCGASKKGLADMVYYKAKDDKHPIQKYDSLKIVEQAILKDYLKNKQLV